MKKLFSKKSLIFILITTLLLASLIITYSIGNIGIVKTLYTAEQAVGDEYEYGYTGEAQEFVTPYTGVYKLEVFGAAGGDQVSNGYYGKDALGGRGGYSVGYLNLTKDQVLYVYVGGKGENVSNQVVNQKGGYNGGAGGSSYSDTASNDEWTEINNNTIYIAPGGGATHIATVNRGTLNTYYSNREDVLIAAGGGGGAIYSYCSGKTYSQTGSTFENWIDPGYGNGGAGGGSVGNPTLTNVRNWAGSGEYGFATGSNGGGAGFKSGYNAAGGTGYVNTQLSNSLMESNVRVGDGYAKITLVEVVAFTVNYDANEGEGTTLPSTSGVQDVNGNALVTLAQNNFTKDGYTFDSWNTKADGTGEKYPAGGEILVSENTTLYAQWKPTTYDISYVLNGGELAVENPEGYDIETENFILNNPTRVGYVFKGWTGANGQEPQLTVRVEKGSTGNKEFVANWEANQDTQYIVRHWLQKQNSNPNEYTEDNYTQKALGRYSGESDGRVTPPVNTYDGFTSPTPQEYIIKADGSLIVDYYYPRNSYNFTLEECEGVDTTGSSQTGTYFYEDVLTLKETTKDGYTWVGWSNGETEDTIQVTINLSDVVIRPIATKNVYTIEYKTNEIGSSETVFSTENPSTYTVTDESFTLVAPTKEGYEFLGWTYEGQEVPQLEVTIEKGSVGNKEFTANWIAQGDTTYIVNHFLQKLDGNAEILDEENYTKDYTDVLTGQSDSTVTPAVKDYDGFTAPETQEVTILPNGGLVVNYYYLRNKYQFLAEEVEGVNKEGTTEDGEYLFETPITVNAQALPGYTWQKWINVGTEQEVVLNNFEFPMPNGNITLKPVVTKDLYTIVYNLEGGIVEEAKEVYTVTDESYTVPTPVKPGYVFAGWSEEGIEGLRNEIVIEKGSTGNREFTANWVLDEHTAYKVEHYIQTADLSDYEIYGTENKEGTTFDEVVAQPQVIAGFKFDAQNENNVIVGNIREDGNLTLKVYYTRNIYAVTLSAGEGTINSENVTNYIYGVETVLPTDVTKEGFTFAGWYDNEELTGEAITKIEAGEAGAKTYYAKWQEGQVPVGDLVIETDEYVIDEENSFIESVKAETTVETFLSKIRVNRDVKVLDKEGNELSQDAFVGTECKLQITVDEENTKTYDILVIGDINSSGTINITDLVSLNKVILGIKVLTPREELIYKKVFDLNKNGNINIADLVSLNHIVLGI